jgi:hypothetical protein
VRFRLVWACLNRRTSAASACLPSLAVIGLTPFTPIESAGQQDDTACAPVCPGILETFVHSCEFCVRTAPATRLDILVDTAIAGVINRHRVNLLSEEIGVIDNG